MKLRLLLTLDSTHGWIVFSSFFQDEKVGTIYDFIIINKVKLQKSWRIIIL
jgi:hypothetical protein